MKEIKDKPKQTNTEERLKTAKLLEQSGFKVKLDGNLYKKRK